MSLLAVRDLKKSFGGVNAVAGVSFDLAAGELLAMIGPNGAGKSTCFNLIGGQAFPDGGSVRFEGAELVGLAPEAIACRGLGRSFQIARVFASMTVRENVQTALLARHGRVRSLLPRAATLYVAEADALLARMGMADQAARPCAALAYGDVKRVELAMALALAPRLLLMDEPTAGMARDARAGLMGQVAALAREHRIGVLFTEHDMDMVFGHADRVIVLDRGAVIAEGAPSAIRADPKVRAVYLGEDVAS